MDGTRTVEEPNPHGRHMRTRSFIGLIFLIVALLIASTPTLLQPTSHGIEVLAAKAGVIDAPSSSTKSESTSSSGDGGSSDPLEARLELKGHVLQENGDMRDTATQIERASNQRGRLEAGGQRILMPGQQENQDAYSLPPVLAEDGLRLDSTGCPTFAEDADIVTLWADEKVQALYEERAGQADDPEACAAAITLEVRAAVRSNTTMLPGDRRRTSASIRSDSERLMFELEMNAMYDAIFENWSTSDKQAAKIRASLGTSN